MSSFITKLFYSIFSTYSKSIIKFEFFIKLNSKSKTQLTEFWVSWNSTQMSWVLSWVVFWVEFDPPLLSSTSHHLFQCHKNSHFENSIEIIDPNIKRVNFNPRFMNMNLSKFRPFIGIFYRLIESGCIQRKTYTKKSFFFFETKAPFPC